MAWVLRSIAVIFLLTAAGSSALAKDDRALGQPTLNAVDRAEALLAEMTIEEKVGQLNLRFLNLEKINPDDDVRTGRVGAFLYASDLGYTNYLQRLAVEESRLHIPLLFGQDVINGYRTIFPAPIALASSWDPALVQKARAIAAQEARAAGINWTYAPMVDIARDPRWGRIVEGAGEDPFLGAAMARAQTLGFQGPERPPTEQLLACVKHFAGYGAADGGRDYEGASIPENLLQNVYLPPFRAAIDAGAGCVMSGYMDLNDVPASGNHWLLQDILRRDWGFRGFVVSDAFAVETLVTHGFASDREDAARRAFTAGINMDMEGRVFSENLPALIARGTISETQLDAAVRPILEAKLRLGLFEHPYADQAVMDAALTRPENRVAARQAAQHSIILLKNSNNALPLLKGKPSKIAVLGPFADSQQDLLGPWTTTADYRETVSILSGIRKKVGPAVQVTYAQGAQISRKYPSEFDIYYRAPIQEIWSEVQTTENMDKAVALAAAADVTVLVLGESFNMAGENASRSSLDLPGLQQQLLERVTAIGKPVILVLISGRPLNITWAAEHTSAILAAWYPGTTGGDAVADVLFGDANPTAKLPVTWPRSVGQVPIYYAHNTTMSPRFAERRYWDEESTPLYPFGFGLSYSGYSFSNLRLNSHDLHHAGEIKVSVDVRNEGSRSGDEIVQLYIHQHAGSAARPVRELKGFQRITLSPNQSRILDFTLAAKDLQYWSSATAAWVLEDEDFDLWVGDSSIASLGSTFRVVP